MKKILLIIIVGIFLFSLVSADLGTYKQGETISVKGNLNASSVNVSIYFPNSSIAIDNQPMTQIKEEIWNYSFSSTDTLGEYIYDYCDQDGRNCRENNFEITPTGFSLETSESLLYIIILIVTFILFLGFLYPAIKLPYSNKTNPDGSIIRITRAKYLKLLSVWFAYGFFMWFLQTLNAISKSFITLTYLSNFITNIFTYSQWFSIGVTFLILIIIFIEIWKDIILSKTIKKYGKAFSDGRLQ